MNADVSGGGEGPGGKAMDQRRHVQNFKPGLKSKAWEIFALPPKEGFFFLSLPVDIYCCRFCSVDRMICTYFNTCLKLQYVTFTYLS